MYDINTIKDADDAREIAMEFQRFASEVPLSWSEVASYHSYLERVAKRFGLTDEFKENGII